MEYESGKYSFAISTMSAQVIESVAVAELYVNLEDWNAVSKEVSLSNTIKKYKRTTAQRTYSEIQKRLRQLTHAELMQLVHGDFVSQRLLILLSICKAYDIIYDFIIEVVRQKFYSYDYILTDSDYYNFFESKKALHPELENISDITYKKIRQRIFTILAQTGLIDNIKSRRILKPVPGKEIETILAADNPVWLGAFLYTDSEISAFKVKYEK
jgi:hypothetical protein